MLLSVPRSTFGRVFLVFLLALTGSISAAHAAAPTPGQLDTTFVPAPGTNDTVNAVIPQPDGKVIAAGVFTFANGVPRNRIARFNSDGSVDLSFDPGNGPNGDVNAIVIQSDGGIVIGGTFIDYNGFARGGVARVLGNGVLDPSFDSGVGTGGNVFALALHHNGQIVLGGRFVQYSGTNRTFIARVFSDGSLDFGFSPTPNDWIQSLTVEPDDHILVGGFFTGINGFGRNSIARLNTNGSVDLTF